MYFWGGFSIAMEGTCRFYPTKETPKVGPPGWPLMVGASVSATVRSKSDRTTATCFEIRGSRAPVAIVGASHGSSTDFNHQTIWTHVGT